MFYFTDLDRQEIFLFFDLFWSVLSPSSIFTFTETPRHSKFFQRDHLWSAVGIICGPGIICGRGSFAVSGSFAALYRTRTTEETTPASDQAPVVQKLDSAIHRINHYPVDKC